MMKKFLPLFDLRVLVVEDTFLIAEDLVQLLSDWGCDVIGPASNLRSALHLANVPKIDAALLDVNLGGEMVFPVAEKLATRNIPFLFLTAYSMKSAFPPAFREIPRVGKPFDPMALARTMTEILPARSRVLTKSVLRV